MIARQNQTRSEKTKLVCKKLRLRLKDMTLDIWLVDKDAHEYRLHTVQVVDSTQVAITVVGDIGIAWLRSILGCQPMRTPRPLWLSASE